MYAAFITVKFDPSRHEDVVKGLHEEVVPQTKQAPGFVKGIWCGDGKHGHGIVLFETEKQAQDMADHTRAAGDPANPVEIESVVVYEVHAEA